MTDSYIEANDIVYYFDQVRGICKANAIPPDYRTKLLSDKSDKDSIKYFNTSRECERNRHEDLTVKHPLSFLCSNEGDCSSVNRQCEQGESSCYTSKTDCRMSCQGNHGWECSGNTDPIIDEDRSAFKCRYTMDSPGSRLGVYSSKKECDDRCSSGAIFQQALIEGDSSLIHTNPWGPGVL